jgi:hypothetical protein
VADVRNRRDADLPRRQRQCELPAEQSLVHLRGSRCQRAGVLRALPARRTGAPGGHPRQLLGRHRGRRTPHVHSVDLCGLQSVGRRSLPVLRNLRWPAGTRGEPLLDVALALVPPQHR